MSIVAPAAGDDIVDTWTSGITSFIDGFIQSVQGVDTGALATGTSFGDVPGLSVGFNVANGNAFAMIHAVFDCNVTVAVAGSGVLQCTINVDGVDITSPEALYTNAIVSRGQCAQTWFRTFSAGAHTVKGRALHSGAVTASVGSASGHSTLTVILFDMP